jgi:S1-C subfamily serine protease
VALGLAAGRDAVAFTRVPDERVPSAGGRGLRVWMGGVPDYGAEERGVRFSGVSAGSPAEKAGLKGGDVLVRLAGREVRGIEDLMDVLSSHASGDTITAVVRRDGREFELPITLAARPASGQ